MDQYLLPVTEVLSSEPGIIAPGLLKYLSTRAEDRGNGEVLVNPAWLYSGNDLSSYTNGHEIRKISIVLNEAWQWLENEGMICPLGDATGNWAIITRSGQAFAEETDTQYYRLSKILSSDGLDIVIKNRVRPLFLAHDFDTAVFRAFKEVESRSRTYANLDISIYGTSVTDSAFQIDTGPLSDGTLPRGEQVAMRNIFSGSLGLFRNPTGHRDVNFNDPYEVAEMILTANLLLRILERRKPSIEPVLE